jgi:spore germination cell wall hydrolase CwlJ-like protein
MIGLAMAYGYRKHRKLEDIDILARTIYGEARGENQEGRIAVANVIINRANHGGWWGDSIKKTCLKPYQFSCWNAKDPNREKLLKVTIDDEDFRDCLEIAALAVNGDLMDNTKNATHYHTTATAPKWAETGTRVATIGNHIFYNNVG